MRGKKISKNAAVSTIIEVKRGKDWEKEAGGVDDVGKRCGVGKGEGK